MVYVWWILGFFFFFFVIICLSKLRIFLDSFFEKENIDIKVRLELWNGLLSYTINVPFVKLLTHSGKKPPSLLWEQETKKSVKKELTYSEFEQMIENAKRFIQQVESLQAVIRTFLEKVEIDKVRWETVFGMKDAAWTGMAIGSLWAVKGSALSVASFLMRMTSEPEMTITPVFGRSTFRTEFSCMIAFRPGHAIVAVIQILSRWRSQKRKWRASAINKQL
ncbi:DUF2953 domain-containing protein [Bacillus sp. REN10]|uniref:DUF2953 domain-containing protein n=1 Tax=Bacillus sp. REN10 TaxID=2782541 RepID=UPI00193C1991|nr:DUF2953 domain-containing protein [Bacillus sp. REN10]